MRIAPSIVAGSIAVLAAIASPVSANTSSLNSHANANAKQTDEGASSPGCSAYQKGPDGSWVQMPCHEGNEATQAPVRSKHASHHPANETTTR
ncbi:MAG TPA: hypothetical protein VIY09_03020 [Rhizomicrobium sp.]|jgi:hypothetical protein